MIVNRIRMQTAWAGPVIVIISKYDDVYQAVYRDPCGQFLQAVESKDVWFLRNYVAADDVRATGRWAANM